MTKTGGRKARPLAWFTERFTPWETHSHAIRRYLVSTRTAFQDVLVADSPSFGRCLILDGEMQSAALDEHVYHEALVHPAMVLHGNPKRVLILGGGEGATLREVLRYRSVREAVMVDIDGEVVAFCKQHLADWHQGSFDSPRARVVIDDARLFVEETREKFDVILSDLPSPIRGGPAYRLYTTEFYRVLRQRLTPGGIFAMQAGSGNLVQFDLHSAIVNTLRSSFRSVSPYYQYIPSFDVPWAFAVATSGADPARLTKAEVDRRLRRLVRGRMSFYDGETHPGLFSVPRHLRGRLDRERRVITLSRPVYFFK